MMNKRKFIPMAIIGYGCIYPGEVNNEEKLWNMVVNGDVHIGVIPKERWDWKLYFSEDKSEEDKTYSKIGGCITNYDFFEKYKEKYKGILKHLNRIQMMSLDTILQCIEKSKYDIENLKEFNVGYIMGNMLGDDLYPDYSLRYHSKEILTYLEEDESFKKLDDTSKKNIKSKLMKAIDERFQDIDKDSPEKYMNSTLTYFLKEILGLKGPSAIIDGACSSGLLVIDEAIKLLNSKEMDMCVVTGALGSVNVIGSVGFSKIGGLSDERSKPLNYNAHGLNSSEGIGTIIIKRLSDAIKDGDKIYSVISGIGSANDGKGKSIYAPNRLGQYKAMKKAITRANLKASDLDYIEVHATGTLTGDIEEIETLKLLFKDENIVKQSIPIGSIKSQIGHSFSAAGMANLFKVIESMKHKTIPPTWGYEKSPEQVCIEESPFYVNVEEKEWIAKEGNPRRAAVNAFGFGGINSSLIVEEYKSDYHKKIIDNMNEEYIDFKDIDVSIVGVGVMDSTSKNKIEWFNNRLKPLKSRNNYPENRWSPKFSEIFSDVFEDGCFIEDYKFPWLKFKIPPKMLEQIDRSQTLSLIVADEAIEDYGYEKMKEKETSVYIGKLVNLESASAFNTGIRYLEYIDRLNKIDEFNSLSDAEKESIFKTIKTNLRSYIPKMTEDALPGYMDNIVSGRISNFYNFTGGSVVIDSGSNSFVFALKQGIYDLVNSDADHVVIGGIHANMTPELLNVFNVYVDKKLDKDSIGVPSEGATFFVLKKSEDVTESDKIYGRIKGIIDENISNDEIVYQYRNKPENIFTDKGKSVNYFGAQLGFELLDVITELQEGNYNNFITCEGNKESQVVRITDKSYLSNDYSIYLSSRDDDSSLQVMKNDILDEKSIDTIYIYGNDIDEVIQKASNINKDNYREYADKESIKGKECRVAITFTDEGELERKLKILIISKRRKN